MLPNGLIKLPLFTIADITHYLTPCYVTHMSRDVPSRHVTLASLSE